MFLRECHTNTYKDQERGNQFLQGYTNNHPKNVRCSHDINMELYVCRSVSIFFFFYDELFNYNLLFKQFFQCLKIKNKVFK